MAEAPQLWSEAGGSGERLLVLLHGLGATGGVWRAFLDRADRFPGRWLAIDLPGHGGSAPLGGYTVAEQVAVIAPAVLDAAAGGPVTLLGHSLGGVIALALAARLEHVDAAFGLGVKTTWTDADLDRMRDLASRPARRFATEAEALAFHARLAGLDGVPPGSPLLARGARPIEEGWQAAMDPRAFAVDAPDMPALLAGAAGRARLATGEHDRMAPRADLSRFGTPVATIDGTGHNAMVDRPDLVWDWVAAG